MVRSMVHSSEAILLPPSAEASQSTSVPSEEASQPNRSSLEALERWSSHIMQWEMESATALSAVAKSRAELLEAIRAVGDHVERTCKTLKELVAPHHRKLEEMCRAASLTIMANGAANAASNVSASQQSPGGASPGSTLLPTQQGALVGLKLREFKIQQARDFLQRVRVIAQSGAEFDQQLEMCIAVEPLHVSQEAFDAEVAQLKASFDEYVARETATFKRQLAEVTSIQQQINERGQDIRGELLAERTALADKALEVCTEAIAGMAPYVDSKAQALAKTKLKLERISPYDVEAESVQSEYLRTEKELRQANDQLEIFRALAEEARSAQHAPAFPAGGRNGVVELGECEVEVEERPSGPRPGRPSAPVLTHSTPGQIAEQGRRSTPVPQRRSEPLAVISTPPQRPFVPPLPTAAVPQVHHGFEEDEPASSPLSDDGQPARRGFLQRLASMVGFRSHDGGGRRTPGRRPRASNDSQEGDIDRRGGDDLHGVEPSRKRRRFDESER